MDYNSIIAAKAIALFAVLLMMPAFASAQTFSEWFRQTRTRKKYLRLQVAALAKVEELTVDGYENSEEGIDIIKYIRDREYAQHFTFFQSLVAVNPALVESPVMKEFLGKEEYLRGHLDELLDGMLNDERFLASDRGLAVYIIRDITHDLGVVDRLMGLLIKPKVFSMNDGDRIKIMAELFRRAEKEYERAILSMTHIYDYIELRRKMETNNDYLKICLQ